MSEETVKDRLLRFIEYKRLSKNRFERICGLSARYVSNISVSIQPDKVLKISEKFPELNTGWLLTGEGEMLKPDQAAVKDYSTGGVPYYAVDFLAGFDLVINDQTVVPDGFISFPHIRGAQAWVDISGKSMSPLIDPGDVIAIKHVEDWQTNILYGEVYALVTEQYRTVKRIRKSDREGWIRLVPENPDYDAQDIPVSSVVALYQVLGCAKKIF
jgi:phage repressor protein C with HTH and peptisase S24 domain